MFGKYKLSQNPGIVFHKVYMSLYFFSL